MLVIASGARVYFGREAGLQQWLTGAAAVSTYFVQFYTALPGLRKTLICRKSSGDPKGLQAIQDFSYVREPQKSFSYRGLRVSLAMSALVWAPDFEFLAAFAVSLSPNYQAPKPLTGLGP